MRLLTFRDHGRLRPALLLHGSVVRRIPETGARPASMRELIEVLADDPGLLATLASAPASEGDQQLADVELGPPIDDPGKLIAIGLNYRAHSEEAHLQAPSAPIVFAKFASSIIGPGATIEVDPELTQSVDYEAELAVVIGRAARRVEVREALSHVFGYTCLNDVSARDLQFGDGQWVRGKSLDTFCPMGPWIVTADEIPTPQSLTITCDVSGETLQSSVTSDMLFSVAELVSYLSNQFTLHPGDVIATGTPEGVGWFRSPPRLLRNGDTVAVEIAEIGRLENGFAFRRPTPTAATNPSGWGV